MRGESWVVDAKRATYGVAVTRILLGVMMFGVLLTNFSTRLYTFGPGAAWTGQVEHPTSDFSKIWPMSVVSDATADATAFTAVYVLAMVLAVAFTVGYRTRLVMIPLFFLWVGIVESNEYSGDQSDNLTRIALIALFFAAPSLRWSIDARRRDRGLAVDRKGRRRRSAVAKLWRSQQVLPAWISNISHNFAIIALAVQVSFIYVAGGLYKAGGDPWMGGWAIYDPIHTRQFGPWPELSQLVTTWGPGVAIATILTLLVQTTFPLLLLRRGTRIFALGVMLAFHLGIAVLMGLPWFSLAMIAIDAIFIRDVTWVAMTNTVARFWLQAGIRPARPDLVSEVGAGEADVVPREDVTNVERKSRRATFV